MQKGQLIITQKNKKLYLIIEEFNQENVLPTVKMLSDKRGGGWESNYRMIKKLIKLGYVERVDYSLKKGYRTFSYVGYRTKKSIN